MLSSLPPGAEWQPIRSSPIPPGSSRYAAFFSTRLSLRDSGRTLHEKKLEAFDFETGNFAAESNMDPKDKTVVDMLSRDRCLQEYGMSKEQLSFTLMTMLHLAPSGYMARVPDLVVRHVPDMYLSMIPGTRPTGGPS